jgi:tetratricopeptide (TPR) repeat protein
MLEARGEFEAAKPYYEDVQKIFEKLSAQEPDKTQWQNELGYAHNNLGKLALGQGRLDVAVAEYRADQGIKRKLFNLDGNNHEAQQNLAVSNAILGRTLAICGQPEFGTRYLNDALADLRALMVFDSTQVDWKFFFARYSEQLGSLLRQLGQFDTAAAAGSDSLRELDALTAKDATKVEWQQELAQSRLESARLALARNDVMGAQKLVASASDALNSLLKNAPDSRNLVLLSAQTDTVAGQIATKRGDVAAARERWTRARNALAALGKAGNDINLLAASATCLLLLDDIEAAQPVVSKLAAIGYRTPDFVALTDSKHVAFPADARLSQRIAEILDQEPEAGEGKQGRGAQPPTKH